MITTFNRTKIIATVGPASDTYEMLVELVQAGVDVFRINFSHGKHEEHKVVFDHIHKINRAYKLNIGILADLQGPKIRVGDLENNKVHLEDGAELIITSKKCVGTAERIYINYPELPREAKPGEKILLDDGKLELEVVKSDGSDELTVRVNHGGPLLPRKGVNLPDTRLSTPSITEKDKKDLKFALANGANWIAMSFVRSADDVRELRSLMENPKKVRIISKIEKPEALEDIDAIVEESDAIMVARGDLGVEVPMEKMPLIQKDLTRRGIRASKPVIVATQIMDSMTTMARPTRAEINDVANGMIDGADALMLSGETAVGDHPVKVIETLVRIMKYIEEQEEVIYNKNLPPEPKSPTFLSDAICFSAARMAEAIRADAIIGMTRSGYTAFMVSSYRPHAKIYIFTDNEDMLNILSLCWGVQAFYYDKFVSTDETITDVIDILKGKRILNHGDVVVNTGSMPIGQKGRANMLKVSVVD